MREQKEESTVHEQKAKSHLVLNSNEDELIDSIWLQKRPKNPVNQGVFLFFIHLFGFGMFYINPTKQRKWIYPIFALFAWCSYINVFVKVIPAMEEFQNKSLIGALTIIVSWFIVYAIGYFDVYRQLYLKSK